LRVTFHSCGVLRIVSAPRLGSTCGPSAVFRFGVQSSVQWLLQSFGAVVTVWQLSSKVAVSDLVQIEGQFLPAAVLRCQQRHFSLFRTSATMAALR
jgi:hypothetical protein